MPGPTHYDVLGVARNATNADIREAYRRLAREHHPDRVATVGDDVRSMPQINEAYRVLGDAARRAVYDAEMRGTGSAVGPAAPPRNQPATADVAQPPIAATPARFPWRSLTFVGVLAIAGLVVIAQFTEPSEPAAPDGIVRIGGCVTIGSDGFARDANCTGDPALDIVVDDIIAFGATCRVGTVGHQDRQGLGVVCVVSPVGILGD